MNHKEVYKAFTKILPFYLEKTAIWFPNGKGSIRIRMVDKSEFIFTIIDSNEWCFETLGHFLRRKERR